VQNVEPTAIYEVEPIPLDLPSVLPPRSKDRDRLRFAACFLLGLIMHGTILWLLERDPRADYPANEEVIPVEVVIEPPPEEAEEQKPEPEKEPEPEKPQQDFYEPPATDAPPASEQDQTGKSNDAQPAEKPAQPVPVPAPAQEPPKAADPWGLQGQLPEIRFETPAPKSNVMRGNAERTYNSILYAHIMQNLQVPDHKTRATRSVKVNFGIDSSGNIFAVALVQSSGDREVDQAAMNAVRHASPVPPPPTGGPIYLTFSLDLR
jgi:protein TonB